MYKDGVLTIADWYKGMVRHPIYGFGLLQNVEVFENKGLVQLKNRSMLDTTVTPTALPLAEVYDVYGNTYTLTGETGVGTVYKNGTAIQSGLPNCWDMKIYKDYLWVRHSTVMSCYGPLNNSPQWFGNVDTGFVNFYNGKLLVGQDDYLYSGNGNNVAKIEVTSSGTPTVTPTLSSNKTALDLPDGQYVSCLEEYGTKIAIGTHGGSSYFDRVNVNNARVYFWNRQLGTLGNPGLADLPIIFNENGVSAIVQHANKLYVSAGTQGNIYVTDSTNYIKLTSIPYSPIGYSYPSKVFSNAMAISQTGRLLVGLSGDLNPLSRMGVYEIDIGAEGAPISYFTPSTAEVGTVGSSTQYKIGFIKPKTYQITKIGWANNSTYGVDTSDYKLYDSYGGIIKSALVRVGGFDVKKTFQRLEFSLASPLVSGQNIRISYRLNDTDDYTEIGTWGYSTIGAISSFADNAIISDVEFIQIKIELDQSTTTAYGSNIKLIGVSLK
jgi:hypothetical protein